jgi:hypothetical protein
MENGTVLVYERKLPADSKKTLSISISLATNGFLIKRCSVRLCLQLFVGERMSYLCYLCLLTHSGVQHILHCAFVRLLSCVLQVSLDCYFFMPLRYFLTFI